MSSALRSWLRMLGVTAALVLTDTRSALAAPSELVLAPPVTIPLGAQATQLRVLDVSGDGNPDLIAADSIAPGLQVLLGQGDGSFGTPIFTPMANLKVFDLGDVNGDSQPDLVTVLDLGSFVYTLQVQLGNGSGAFALSGGFDVSNPGSTDALLLLDVDEDGDLDAMLEQAGQLRTLLGDGAGGFAAPGPFFPASGIGLHQELHALDANGDGHLDVMGSGNASLFTGWAVYLGDGDGGFTFSQYGYNSSDGDLHGSALGDFEGDHRTDFVLDGRDLGCGFNCYELGFAQGTGSGFATPSPDDVAAPGLSPIRAGDLDGDGLADVAGRNGSQLWVLLGQGDFTFTVPQTFALGLTAVDLALADVNGDARLDVLTLNKSGSVRLLLNQTQPAAPPGIVLVPAQPVPLAGNAWRLRAVDVSGDGLVDLVAGGGLPSVLGIQVLLGQGGAAFGAPIITPIVSLKQFDIGDVDADGWPDLVTVDGDIPVYTLRVHLGDGPGSFAPGSSIDVSIPGGMDAVLLLDIDEDGDLDAVLEQGGNLRACLGDGAGGFAAPGQPFGPFPVLAIMQELHTLDVNGDGHLDVVGSGYALFADGWAVLLGDGHGGLAVSQTEFPGGDIVGGNALADFDGDHRTDFVLGDGDSQCLCSKLAFAQGTGSSLVPRPVEFDPPGTAFPAYIRAGDLDGDGLADVVGNVMPTGQLEVLRGRGDFTFDGPQFAPVAPPGTYLPDLALVDVDGDDRLDVLVLREPGVVLPFLNESPPSGWTDLGHGLAGSDGVPSLLGVGKLQAGSSGALKLTHANPDKLAALVIGASRNPVPFKGGTLVPVPVSILFMVGTDPDGTITLPWNGWPQMPVGTDWFFQFAIVDSAAPAGASLSNAVRALQP